MDRARFTIVGCGVLAAVLASAGCRHLPTRRVPPEQPYPGQVGGPREIGFGSAPPTPPGYEAFGSNPVASPTNPYDGGGAPASPYADYGTPAGLHPGGTAPAGPSQAPGLEGYDGAPQYNMGSPGAPPSPY